MADPDRIPRFFESIGFSHSDKKDWDANAAKSELKNGRPVIIKAKTPAFLISTNQHIWVAEGYQFNPNTYSSRFYMNWGWRGSENGWFWTGNWKPKENDYSEGRKMIRVWP
ncbi:MAG: C10 family peptidase [Cyclobacteriaceae bacterium]